MKTRGAFFMFLETCLLLQLTTAIGFGITPQHHGKRAVTEDALVWTGNGRTAHVLCKTVDSRPIDNCQWDIEIPNKPNEVSKSFTYPKEITRPGYSGYGKGLNNGECGVLISQVNENDAGLWNCTLLTKNYGVFYGTVQVSLFQKPMFKPEIDSAVKKMKTFLIPKRPRNDGVDISCCATDKNALPNPTLYFQIDNRTVSENYTHCKNQDGLSCITWKAMLNYTMNQKKLHCIMDHIAFTEEDAIQEDTFLFNLEFSPVLLGYQQRNVVKIEIPMDTSRFNISIKARANPLPQTRWLIKSKEGKGDNRVETNDNFILETLSSITDLDEIQATLIIVDSNRLTVNESVTLYVHNVYGSTELRFEFTVPHSNTTHLLIIILTTIASILLLAGIVVTVFIILARRRHRGTLRIQVKPKLNPETTTAAIATSNRAMGEVATNPEETHPVIPPIPPPRSFDKEVITNV